MATAFDTTLSGEHELVIAFCDLTRFTPFARANTAGAVAALVARYYELVGDSIEPAGGLVVKFMGDAALIVFPAAAADRAANALLQLQSAGDAWLTEQQIASRQLIKAHIGPVYCGRFGTRTDKRFDVFGETVNTTAQLPAHGLAITTELFRKLAPETRKHFKKHTPPVTYIPLAERHRD